MRAAVELHQAFLWTCEECGRDNFERAITHEPGDDDEDEIPEGFEGVWLTAPTEVTCKHCGEEFDIADPA